LQVGSCKSCRTGANRHHQTIGWPKTIQWQTPMSISGWRCPGRRQMKAQPARKHDPHHRRAPSWYATRQALAEDPLRSAGINSDSSAPVLKRNWVCQRRAHSQSGNDRRHCDPRNPCLRVWRPVVMSARTQIQPRHPDRLTSRSTKSLLAFTDILFFCRHASTANPKDAICSQSW
jgi:hypothetical protein